MNNAKILQKPQKLSVALFTMCSIKVFSLASCCTFLVVFPYSNHVWADRVGSTLYSLVPRLSGRGRGKRKEGLFAEASILDHYD